MNVTVSWLRVISVCSAGSMDPFVPGTAILDDSDHLSWLLFMESAGLDIAVLDNVEPLVWFIPLTSMGLVVGVPAVSFVASWVFSASWMFLYDVT